MSSYNKHLILDDRIAIQKALKEGHSFVDIAAIIGKDDVISPLVKQGQSIHQICINNADLIMVDERTIYNYIDAGILSVGNLDLPRKVRYKKRKKKKQVTRTSIWISRISPERRAGTRNRGKCR